MAVCFKTLAAKVDTSQNPLGKRQILPGPNMLLLSNFFLSQQHSARGLFPAVVSTVESMCLTVNPEQAEKTNIGGVSSAALNFRSLHLHCRW